MVLKGPLERIVRAREAEGRRHLDERRARSASARRRPSTRSPRRGRSSQLVDERTAAIYELGLDNLQLSPGGGASPEVQRRFEAGLIDLRRRHQLYAEDPRGVEISEGVLYRARIRIPARVPVGTYTAETFLIRDGRVIAGAAREIRIEKLGFERFVADAAERWSLRLRHRRGGAVAAARLGGQRASSSAATA